MNNNTNISMNRILAVTLLISLMSPASVMATGPRVTAHIFTPGTEIYALDFPPFISTEVVEGGLDAEIINAALKAADIDAAIRALPLGNMVKYYLTQENAIVVLGRHHLSFSAKQKKDLIFIPVSVTSESYFYYKPAQKLALSWNGKLKNLKGNTYGAHKGEDVVAYKDAGINIDFGKPHTLLKKLKSKKIDFIKLPELTAEWMIDKYFPEEKANFTQMETSIGEKPTFIVFSKNHPDGEAMAKKFSAGLSKIINNGSYMAILEKYLGKGDRTARHMESLQRFSDK